MAAGDVVLQFFDAYLTGVSDGSYSLGEESTQLNNLYITGLAYIDGLGESMLVDNTYEIQFRATTQRIWSSAGSTLDIDSATTLNFLIGTGIQFALTDGVITPNADNDLDLGSAAVAFKSIYAHNIYGQSGYNMVCCDNDVLSYDNDLVFISS